MNIMKSETLTASNSLSITQSHTVRTVVDWNNLEQNIMKAGTADAFTSALNRSTPPAP